MAKDGLRRTVDKFGRVQSWKTLGTGEMVSYHVADLIAENDRLYSAIKKTLDENLHLADGENCTLIDLKRAID